MLKRVLFIILTIVTVISLAACSSQNQSRSNLDKSRTTAVIQDKKQDTLIIGVQQLQGVFSPFFYSSTYDAQVNETLFSSVGILDQDNTVKPHMGVISESTVVGEQGEIEQMKYTITLKKDLVFSDGTPVTIDDLIFTYYVLSDPKYDGASDFQTLNIEGMKAYYYDTEKYEKKVKELEKVSKKVTDSEVISAIKGYTDTELKSIGAEKVNQIYDLGLDAATTDFEVRVSEAFFNYNKTSWDYFVAEAQKTKYKRLEEEYIENNLEDGIDVSEISGIKRINDYSCTVLLDGVNIRAKQLLGLQPVMPKHYYGVEDDGTAFGKSDIDMVKAKNNTPLGSGPFVFDHFDGETAVLTSNPAYFNGEPTFTTLIFKVVPDADKVQAILSGEVDIITANATKEVYNQLQENEINYTVLDNNGFGYISISAKRIPNIDVRKGIMHLMDRESVIDDFYGSLATVIERPMTTVLPEYPDRAREYYDYNTKKAMKFFKKAGYNLDKDNKLVNKLGKQLVVEVGIGDFSTHPSAGILEQMQLDMRELGAELIITDLNSKRLTQRINQDDLDMWVAAWNTSTDCNLYDRYHSSQAKAGGLNRVYMEDEKMDQLLESFLVTIDSDKRKKIVEEELDLIMDWAVCMPVYQRKNFVIYDEKTINIKSLPDDGAYLYGIEKLELN